MPVKAALPVVGLLSALGAGAGIWLGHAAVGEIDPAYYREPPTSFVADRIAYRSPDWAGVQLGEYQQQGLLDGIGAEQAPSAAVYAAPAVATYGDSWAADTAREAQPVRAVATRPIEIEQEADVAAPPDPEIVRVHRYSSYPVSQEEARAIEVAEPEVQEVYAATYEVPAE
ncbi:hypothetical protein [Sphingosinicella sp. BN140058]|uniref:hypothetical protein n=1 Tax=Sphingosinicella sp. BN140058 TaxID=1892855 RepID=UPI001010156C|nr:hypothetical protein [Sphingosinicella sp. BN140058]QAY79406.1 hypothetical protein ETR14_24840 [Sphingosinicella sp. BN140058]